MAGAEDTTGAVIEAETEAAATMEGVRDVPLSGFVDSAQSVKKAGERSLQPIGYGEAGGSLSVGMPAR
jgi:hypothetical protein